MRLVYCNIEYDRNFLGSLEEEDWVLGFIHHMSSTANDSIQETFVGKAKEILVSANVMSVILYLHILVQLIRLATIKRMKKLELNSFIIPVAYFSLTVMLALYIY